MLIFGLVAGYCLAIDFGYLVDHTLIRGYGLFDYLGLIVEFWIDLVVGLFELFVFFVVRLYFVVSRSDNIVLWCDCNGGINDL